MMAEKLRLGWGHAALGQILTHSRAFAELPGYMDDGWERARDRTREVSAGVDETALKGFIYLTELSELTKDAAASLRTEVGHNSRGHEQETL